jgi:predicted O-linked N-acetylglucosamine transferase (SPINDLY family)
VAPDRDYLLGHLLHLRMHECIWQDWERDTQGLLARVARGERVATPFSLMGTPADAATLLAGARTFAESRYPARDNDASAAAMSTPGDATRKLRIAYFCADFRNHATSQLMVRLFECHDRTRF